MASLDIAIVNWNTGPLLGRCIQSLTRIDLEGVKLGSVCIVDNASQDRSLDIQAPSGLPIDIVKNTSNWGFAAASNLGASRGNSQYILFLNPDTELHNASLSTSIRFLEDPSNDRFGICGIQMVDQNGHPAPCVSRFPSVSAFMYKAVGLSQLFRVACASVLLPAGYPRGSGEVDQVIGAFMLVRRRVFQTLGGFDERFFVYFEDADFSLRAKRAGHSSYFLKEATAFHKGHGSSENVKALRLFYSLRSRLQYSEKHFGAMARAATFVITVLLEPLTRTLQAGASFSVTSLRETIAGYSYLYRWLVMSRVPR